MEPDTENDQRTWYRSCGLKIVSALPLDELIPMDTPGQPDLSIELIPESRADEFAETTTHAHALGEIGAPWMEIRRGEDGYLARWPDQLDVIVPDDGERMLVCQRGEVDDSIPRLLLCHSLSFVLPAHGREGLHASAVEVDGKAIVLSGQTGRGKSTLATALCDAGGKLIADDLTSVRIDQDGVPVVEASTNRTWLIREVAQLMTGEEADASSPRTHKIAVGGHLTTSTDAVPVGAVYLLRMGDTDPAISARWPQREAVVGVLSALFNYLQRTPARMSIQFDAAAAIAAHVPVRMIQWRPGPEAAPAMAERLIEQLRAPAEAADRDAARFVPAGADGVHVRAVSNGHSHGNSNGNGNGHAPPRKRNGSANGGARRARGVVQVKELLEQLEGAGMQPSVERDDFDEPLLRTAQVAALLRTSDRTVRTWADAGKLTYIKTLGGRRLFPASAVMEVISEMRGEGR